LTFFWLQDNVKITSVHVIKWNWFSTSFIEIQNVDDAILVLRCTGALLQNVPLQKKMAFTERVWAVFEDGGKSKMIYLVGLWRQW
jgi:hypothetical protein